MFKKILIKKFLSGVLLAVFVLGITPKRFLHDVFARHTDIASKLEEKPYQQLSKAGYNCEIDNLVAESPFEGYFFTDNIQLPSFHSEYVFEDYSFSSATHIYSFLRGPPVNI